MKPQRKVTALAIKLLPLAALGLAYACGSQGVPVDDGEGDAFLRAAGISENSPEARGVLRVANEVSEAALVSAARVQWRAAQEIVRHRAGPDTQPATADDNRFDTLQELDDVPWVGQQTFERMLAYARSLGWVSADDSGSGSDATVNEVCPTQHGGASADGDQVVFCDVAFNERPFVRPAPDQLTGTSIKFTAGLIADGQTQLTFVGRDGKDYVVLDAEGNQRPSSEGIWAFAARVLPNLRMPSNRNLFTLYTVEGSLQSVETASGSATGIRVTSAGPAIILSAEVIDGTMRTWEGELAPGTGNYANAYDWTKAVRFRLQINALEPAGPPFNGNMFEWADPATKLSDGRLFAARGTVANARTSVRSSDGSCLPRLDQGTFQPLGALPDAGLTLLRFPAMHGPGDQVFTIAPSGTSAAGDHPEGMVPILLTHPASFLMANPTGRWFESLFTPHGYPHNIAVKLHPVTGGGGSCN